MITNAGKDWKAGVLANPSSNGSGAYGPANIIGLSSNGDAVVDTDTVLAGEIVAGTLVRGIATFSHTSGTASYTLTRTFTSDQTVTIKKIGVFNAAGTLIYAKLLDAGDWIPAQNGDQFQISQVVPL